MAVDEVNEFLGAELPTGDWDTIGGLVLAVSGHVPTEGESIEVDDHLLVAEKVQGRRVGSVRVDAAQRTAAAHRAPRARRPVAGRTGRSGRRLGRRAPVTRPAAVSDPGTVLARRPGRPRARIPLGLRGSRRQAERRQVHAFEPDPRPQGRHHGGLAQHDQDPHPRHARKAREPNRLHRHPRAAPAADRSRRPTQRDRDGELRGRRLLRTRGRSRRPDRPRGPLHRRAPASRQRDRPQQDRPRGRRRGAGTARHGVQPARHRGRRVLSRLGPDRRRRERPRRAPRRPDARKGRGTSRPGW